MDRPQPEELPLHHSILSDATTSEEILLTSPERPADHPAATEEDPLPVASIGTGGETDPEAPLPNHSGLG